MTVSVTDISPDNFSNLKRTRRVQKDVIFNYGYEIIKSVSFSLKELRSDKICCQNLLQSNHRTCSMSRHSICSVCSVRIENMRLQKGELSCFLQNIPNGQ